MLLFRSEGNIEAWCVQQQMPRGQVLALEQVWLLSQHWYADRLHPDFTGRTPGEAEAIFEHVGLTGKFWQFGADTDNE